MLTPGVEGLPSAHAKGEVIEADNVFEGSRVALVVFDERDECASQARVG
jgi:hypothetical protein